MAPGIDRSKYRNPDIPVGYVKTKPKIVYKEGVVIDGYNYIFAPIIHEVNVAGRPDYPKFKDLSFLSDSDEDEPSILFSGKEEKKKKEIETIKIEPDEYDGVKRKTHAKKKDYEHTSLIDDFYSKMEIDVGDKGAKKKIKKIKKEHKSGYRSDSNSPSRHRKHRSPHSSHRYQSSSPDRKHDSPSRNTKYRSPSKDHESTFSFDDFLSKMKIDPDDKDEIRKKLKKIKKEHKSGYRSNSESPPHNRRTRSPHSSHRRRSSSPDRKHDSPSKSRKHRSPSKENLVNYSRSPSPIDVKVKLEHSEPEVPQHLFGSYQCDVCNITMNSLLTFNTHLNGKKHLKAMKMKKMSDVVVSNPSSSVLENQSKYPKIPAGFTRKRVATQSAIQELVEQSTTKPCPGLNNLIEIQGLGQIHYYCKLCDSSCSPDSVLPHLNGFKHQLHCLKHFKPGAYEAMQYEPKYKIEREIRNILLAVEKREGKGRITVEVEEMEPKKEPSKTMSQASSSRSQPSTSRDTSEDYAASSYEDSSIAYLDKTADYFCKVCQSHMNSLQMWESHIRGKRHLTNLKKLPGDKPSKTKTVHVPNKKAYLLERIKREIPHEPVVGLKEIRETEIVESNSHSYQCFLCGSCHTTMDILDHLMSMKHRAKYLDLIEFPGREITYGMSESVAIGLVRDMCAEVEAEEGTGQPEVHVNKSSLYR